MVVPQPIMQISKAATENLGLGLMKGSPLHRTHFSGPSGGGYHQHHHVYHVSDHDNYQHGSSDHGSKKKSIALSALTLLAFLFFLNILQNCIQDQMDDMNQQQIIVMTSRLHQLKEAQNRNAEEKLVSVNNNDNDDERNFGKEKNFQRKVDTISRPNNYSNVTVIKINTKSTNNRNNRP